MVLSEKKPKEIHDSLSAVLGELSPSILTMRKWTAKIQEDGEDADNEKRSGRPKTGRTEEALHLVKVTVDEDRRRKCEEIEAITGPLGLNLLYSKMYSRSKYS